MIRASGHSLSRRAEIELRYAPDSESAGVRSSGRRRIAARMRRAWRRPRRRRRTRRSVNIDLANRTSPPMRLGSHVLGKIGIFLGRFARRCEKTQTGDEGIIDFNAQIPDGALDLGMSQRELHDT